jgi:3-dehydroquinate synthase
MITLELDLGERSYPIFIGSGLLGQAALLRPYIRGERVLIVSNEVVAPLYLQKVQEALGELRYDVLVLPDGEHSKTLQTLSLIYDKLLEGRHERSSTLIALGGGVVGDITGFAAATYQRGVNFIQIPTTLLSQVDSSVGGKTGVNHPLGKNMIGAFYQPQCVLADTDVLASLPPRELRAGIAEVIKYGLIDNLPFFEWLETHIEALLAGDKDLLAEAVRVSCADKARIVAADEKEGGVRALLNLGHTFGHAIENGMGYGVWLHGEAVATGMVMAADLSARLGYITWQEAARAKALIERAGLPVVPPEQMSAQDFLKLMSFDKKVQGGKIRFILMQGLGGSVIESNIDASMLEQTLEAKEQLCQH